LVSNEHYVEKLLCNDAAKIVIDEEFKGDLKNRIMFGDKCSNITQLPKHKNNFKQSKYFKIASGFVICIFVSGTIFKVIDVQTKNMFAKVKGQPDVIIPLNSAKNSAEDKTNATISLSKELVENDINSKSNMVKKGNESEPADTLEKPIKKDAVVINKNTEKISSGDKIVAINNGPIKNGVNGVTTVVSDPINVPNAPNVTSVPNVPKMENVKEDVSSSLNVYDSSYSLDKSSLANVRAGGIYVTDVESSTEKKVIAYNEKTQIVEKPNITPNDEIIYYKAEKVTLENGKIGVEKGAIYLTDKKGQDSIKLVDGKSPMVSKDGKNLVYETEGKIYILTLATNNKRFVDNGKDPAFSDNGNIISYVKEDKETQSLPEDTGKKDVFIQKSFSSLWIFNLATQNTHSLTNSEVNINNDSIQSWVDAVKSGTVTTDLKVTSKYSYFESIWSSDNKQIYVIRKNNEEQIFELIKVSTGK